MSPDFTPLLVALPWFLRAALPWCLQAVCSWEWREMQQHQEYVVQCHCGWTGCLWYSHSLNPGLPGLQFWWHKYYAFYHSMFMSLLTVTWCICVSLVVIHWWGSLLEVGPLTHMSPQEKVVCVLHSCLLSPDACVSPFVCEWVSLFEAVVPHKHTTLLTICWR